MCSKHMHNLNLSQQEIYIDITFKYNVCPYYMFVFIVNL